MFHILLVDDDEDEHLFFQWSLEKISVGIKLMKAFSCRHAQKLLLGNTPDIIFLDINLPGEDGFVACKPFGWYRRCKRCQYI